MLHVYVASKMFDAFSVEKLTLSLQEILNLND